MTYVASAAVAYWLGLWSRPTWDEMRREMKGFEAAEAAARARRAREAQAAAERRLARQRAASPEARRGA